MIETDEGKRVTAKQAAAHTIAKAIQDEACCADAYVDRPAMTGREEDEYLRHLNAYYERIGKVLGQKV